MKEKKKKKILSRVQNEHKKLWQVNKTELQSAYEMQMVY